MTFELLRYSLMNTGDFGAEVEVDDAADLEARYLWYA
jgi:hypothetical protein